MAAHRSTTVAKGGFWSTPQAVYSKETQQLLKEMMKESKLTNFQQRHLERTLRDGSTLPAKVPPTHSYKEPPKPSPLKKDGKMIDPKTYSGGVRSLDTMQKQGAFEKPDYRPPRGQTRPAREKIRLANIMAYGSDIPPVDANKVMKKAVEADDVPEVDRFEELQKEVAERKSFLDDMVSMGKGSNYTSIINTEISQMVREMELIDKRKTSELNDLIQKQETRNNVTEHSDTALQTSSEET